MVVTEEQIAAEEAKFEETTKGFDELLSSLNLTRAQLRAFVKDAEQFTEEDWETMQKMRAKFDEKLHQMPLHRKSASTRKSLSTIQPNWIFVR